MIPIEKNLHKGHRERVRQRYLKSGLDSFEDHQILEMLLFYCYPMKDTNEMAHGILKEYGNLHNLFDSSPLDISRRCKITMNSAILLSMIPSLSRRYFIDKWDEKLILDDSEKAGLFCVSLFIGRVTECMYIVCLNNNRSLISAEKIFEGTINETPIYPREIVETVIKYQAVSVILSHNHPGGILSPSRSDIEATKKIINILEAIGVEVIDHIIVSGENYYSFSEKRTLPLWY